MFCVSEAVIDGTHPVRVLLVVLRVLLAVSLPDQGKHQLPIAMAHHCEQEVRAGGGQITQPLPSFCAQQVPSRGGGERGGSNIATYDARDTLQHSPTFSLNDIHAVVHLADNGEVLTKSHQLHFAGVLGGGDLATGAHQLEFVLL